MHTHVLGNRCVRKGRLSFVIGSRSGHCVEIFLDASMSFSHGRKVCCSFVGVDARVRRVICRRCGR
jgi:hypothetical protein